MGWAAKGVLMEKYRLTVDNMYLNKPMYYEIHIHVYG